MNNGRPDRPAGPKRVPGAAPSGDRAGPTGLFRSRPSRKAAPNAVTADGAAPGERKIRAQQVGAETAPLEERIAKVIARAGVASRRDAEAMIAEGRVTLDGAVVTSPALNVGIDARITVDGEALPLRERTRLWLFHKPRGLVTTFRDPEGRPTVFEALPDELPRVVAIGRLDINTEGLLLLTNDGGLARVIAHPDTGWLRRYRVRAHGDTVTQEQLNGLRNGITIDGIEYGPIEANLDRAQGDNVWITLGLREGKNREVKRILENMGLQVNRLIRLSFGPFQLGDIESGMVEEVRTRVLKDQLGDTLSVEAGVDFDSPVREPIAPFGAPPAAEPERGSQRVRSRSAADTDRWGGDNKGRPARSDAPRGRGDERPSRDERPARGERPQRADERVSAPRRAVWHAGEPEGGEVRAARPYKKREDPRAERQASAERPRERVGAIRATGGRKVLIERLVTQHEPEERPKAARPTRDAHDTPRRERGSAKSFGDKPSFGDRPAGERGGPRKPSGYKSGNRPRQRDDAPRAAPPGFRDAGPREAGSFSPRPVRDARPPRDDRPTRDSAPRAYAPRSDATRGEPRGDGPRGGGGGKFGAPRGGGAKFGGGGSRDAGPRGAGPKGPPRGRPPAGAGPQRGR